MDTLICPKGHVNVENNLHSNVNRGIRCLTCEDRLICDGCGHSVIRIHGRNGLVWPGVRWIGSMELAELGLIERGNPRDGGVYGLCPSCRKATMHKPDPGSWYDLATFEARGGKRIRMEARSADTTCKSFVIADAELVILCRAHATGYAFHVDSHGIVPLGTPEAGEEARCTMCWRVPEVGGILVSTRVLIDGRPFESYAKVLETIDKEQRAAGLPGLAEEAIMKRYYDEETAEHRHVDSQRMTAEEFRTVYGQPTDEELAALERATLDRLRHDRRAVFTHEKGGPVRPSDQGPQPSGPPVRVPIVKTTEIRKLDTIEHNPDDDVPLSPEEEERIGAEVDAAVTRFLSDNFGRIASVRVVDPPEDA
jgi:hypothetical protein